MDIQLVREFLENECERREEGVFNRSSGRRVSAILPVHILGHPVNMDALMQVAEEFALKVVEDSTESLGATVRSRPTGTIGHVGCFSFNGNKLITTGGGGMVVSPDPKVTQYVRYLSTQAKDPGTEYIHREIGFNYRLTNIQAALGCAQLEQLDAFLKKKRKIAQRYTEALQDLPGWTALPEAKYAESANWLFTALVDKDIFGIESREVGKLFAESAITTRPLWQPMHQCPAHQPNVGNYPVADTLYQQAVSLPSSVGIREQDIDRILSVLRGLQR
jgi:perosamine synthetase